MSEFPDYHTVDDLLGLLGEPNRTACKNLLADNIELFKRVQGSTHNHQAWPGGYYDHVSEVMNIGFKIYNLFGTVRRMAFPVSDLMLVLFLHDVEKPWKYEIGLDGQLQHRPGMETKQQHQEFRLQKLAEYGIVLTPEHENGLKYAEGEISDYSNRERKMGPLAAMAHMADVASARIWFDYPAAEGDLWYPARRSGTV